MSNDFQREHRVGSYNKGCRCYDCRLAICHRQRRLRRRKRLADPAATEECRICGDRFHNVRGLARHVGAVHPYY